MGLSLEFESGSEWLLVLDDKVFSVHLSGHEAAHVKEAGLGDDAELQSHASPLQVGTHLTLFRVNGQFLYEEPLVMRAKLHDYFLA